MKNRQLKLDFQKSIFFLILFLLAYSGFAQKEAEEAKEEAQKYINEAQQAMSENDFANAEASYRKAIAKDPANVTAKYNMGNLYYTREKTGEAQSRLRGAKEVATNKAEKHRISHNLGNSFMKQKKYKEAVDAYKEALRNDPSDDETRYNLALAKEKLKEEQDKNQNKDKNKDNKDNKDDNKKDQNKDQKDQGDKDKDKDGQPKDKGDNDKQDKKDGEGDQDKNKQDQDNKKDKTDKGKQDQEGNPDKKPKQQQQPVQGQLSPQQIKNLLKAMNNEEEKTQDKINAEKAKGVKTRSDKDW